jgi:hypothetical protein
VQGSDIVGHDTEGPGRFRVIGVLTGFPASARADEREKDGGKGEKRGKTFYHNNKDKKKTKKVPGWK